MQYVGGKQKSGGHLIAEEIRRFAQIVNTNEITDTCCGALSVTARLVGMQRRARDLCPSLITLFKSMQEGWIPPGEVDRETWEHYKATQDPTDPMTAFVGFGCSRSGDWFSSYVDTYKYTGQRRVPAATAARDSLIKKLTACKDVEFAAGDYGEAEVRGVWYCDIPYVNSLGYAAVGPFDHGRFWLTAREVSRWIPVLVSEQVAPEDFKVIREWSVQRRLNTGTGGRRVERLFVHERWAA